MEFTQIGNNTPWAQGQVNYQAVKKHKPSLTNYLKICVQRRAESEGPWGRAEAHEHRMWKRQSALNVYTMSLP